MIEVGSEDTGTRDDTASSVSTGTERLVLWSGSVAAFPFRSVRAKKKKRKRIANTIGRSCFTATQGQESLYDI